MRNISISPAMNGWIVKIDCQTVVFEDIGDMLSEIGRYIENPKDVEREYYENAVNKCEVNELQDASAPGIRSVTTATDTMMPNSR